MTEQQKIMAGDKDITEGVQILYDITHDSMDWRSGFLDNEEMEKVIQLAIDMGWEVPNPPHNRAPAMETVFQKFPGHYKITKRRAPGVTVGPLEVLEPHEYYTITKISQK